MYELRRAHFKGNSGKAGKSQKRNGNIGKDIRYSVPIGTEVYEVKKNSSGLSKDKAHLGEIKYKIADLDEAGAEIRVAKGGQGGLGNYRNRHVYKLEHGKTGERKEYELRLKLIADVGFIGYPNAGKLTLLSALTRAFPKIAHYPFTTLRPYIG